MKITKEQQDELAGRARIIDMAGPLYLRKKTNENYRFIVRKILGFANDVTTVDGVDMSQLIVESGLYSAITGAYKDSIGWLDEIDDTDMARFIDSLIATGKAGFRLEKNDTEKKLHAVQSSAYFESYDEEDIYTEIKLYTNKKETYAFTRTFYSGRNENKLYKMGTGLTSIADAVLVPLSTIPETALLKDSEATGFTIPAFIHFSTSERIFESVKTLVDSIDRRMTEIELEFHKHLDAKTIYSNIDIPESAVDKVSGKILKEKMWNAFFSTSTDADIRYITNSNPMIDKAMEFIDRDIRRISAISKVPLDYLWVSTSDGAIGAESRNAKNAIFFSKIEKIRGLIIKAHTILVGTEPKFWPIIGFIDPNTTTNGNNINSWTAWGDKKPTAQ